jgi:low temperature requirement protein LtrA
VSPERPVSSLLRGPPEHGHAPVGYIELFFDLVYVFAITQLSHHLLEHRDWLGALQTALLFLAVWWAWIYTTWATNWIDPDHGANRLMLGAVMIGSLVMSSAIPFAFGKSGLVFAVAYVAVQVGRSLYLARALGEWRPGGGKSITRISIWFAASAVPWLAGGFAPPEARLFWWIGALTIESLGPVAFYRVPGLGRSKLEDWNIAGGHMAERCALFIIIALGEGVLITGVTFGKLVMDTATIAAFVTAFVGSFAMWWVYFDVGAKRGAAHIEHHDNPGLIGRNAFTYWHIPIVAGVILIAVADELTLAHPLEPVHADFLLITASGMALFLGGTMTFKRISSARDWFPLSHQAGLWLVAALTVWGWLAHPRTLIFYMAATTIFALVALWEWGSFHGGWLDRMERRGWRLGRLLRRYSDWRLAEKVTVEEPPHVDT